MTLSDFSVLLLAWDDADPSVAVLGGTALPATLPLVYQLAEQQPVVAVYPHLPPAEAPTDASSPSENPELTTPLPTGGSTEPAAATPAEEQDLNAYTTLAPTPGVRLLAGASPTGTGAEIAQLQSRIIGLDDLSLASTTKMQAEVAAAAAAPATEAEAARNQWPTAAGRPQPGQWQAPAAPYQGATPPQRPLRVPVASSPSSSTVREAADLSYRNGFPPFPGAAQPAASQPNLSPRAGDLNFDPDPELPRLLRPEAFSEMADEPGPDETADIVAPEDNITPDDEPVVAEVEALANPAPQAVAPEPAVLMPALDGLNFRMIQYARRAAQLVRGRSDFGVIYAPNWPAWLAALEIRNSTGQPLVLYVAGLAADFDIPGERGWLLEVERMTLRRAQVILVPNAGMQHRLSQQYGASIGEVRVVAAADEAGVQRVLNELALG